MGGGGNIGDDDPWTGENPLATPGIGSRMTVPEAEGPPKDGIDVAPPLLNGRFRLVRTLGAGGMATVYCGWDAQLAVYRAIKVLSSELCGKPTIRQRFFAEAQTMARLEHPHIARVTDALLDGDRLFMVMELLRGGSLHDYLVRSGPLPGALAVHVLRMLLSALHYAHQSGVVHRDVKPHNVLLTLDGTPKLTDFGIAQLRGSDYGRTRTGVGMGTPAFMAPEQQSDARSADARSDVYAAGATLFHLVTAEEPYDLSNPIVQERVFTGLPDALADVLRTACAYERDDRYPSAQAMRDALKGLALPKQASARSTNLKDLVTPLPAIPTDPMGRRGGSYSPTAAPSGTFSLDNEPEDAPAEEAAPGEEAAPEPASPVDRTNATLEPSEFAAALTGRRPLAAMLAGSVVFCVSALAGLWMVSGPPAGVEPAPEAVQAVADVGPSPGTVATGATVPAGAAIAAVERAEATFAAYEAGRADPVHARGDIAAALDSAQSTLRATSSRIDAATSADPKLAEALAAFGRARNDLEREAALAALPADLKGYAIQQQELALRVADLEGKVRLLDARIATSPPSPTPSPIRVDPPVSATASEAGSTSQGTSTATPTPAAAASTAASSPTTASPPGTLTVMSFPFSSVEIDGVPRGDAPWKGELPAGRHEVVLTSKKAGDGRTQRMTVVVRAGESTPFCWDFDAGGECER